MIDDEKLQQLLSKASSLYNGGEYKGAIEAWHEALGVDPSSQKAREGIRMATLLMGDWEPAASEPAVDEPADGGAEGGPDLSAEELEAKLDLGIARVKQLLAQRKFSDAVDGARGLLPINPDSEQVQRLLEQAQHAFEAIPFIDEHLTLARELMEQERYPEAETECKKIFTLDGENPEAQALLATIRAKVQGGLKKAAAQIGGMTVKLTAGEVMAAAKDKASAAAGPNATSSVQSAAGPKEKMPAAPAAAGPKGRPPESVGNSPGDLDLDGADEPAIPLAGAKRPEDGHAAASQEEVAARNALDAAFEQAGVDQELPVAEPIDDAEALKDGEAFFTSAPTLSADQPEVVEAQTVVAPSTRVVPRHPPSPEPAKNPAAPTPAPAAGAAAAKPATASPGPAPKAGAVAKGPTAKPAPAPAFDETAWEAELTQLNIKQDERTILKGTSAKIGSAPQDAQADADLMSFLDNDLGGISKPAAGAAAAEALAGAAGPSIPLKKETKPAADTPKPKRQTPAIDPTASAEPEAVPHARPAAREKAPPLPGPKSRSSLPRLFALLGLILLAGVAAAWWFLFQPRSAGGAGNPAPPAVPPSSSAPGPMATEGQGAIPTPIGSTSRQPAAAAQGAAVASAAPDVAPPAPPAPSPATSPAQADTAPLSPEAGGAGTPAPAAPIKPPVPALSPEEAHRKIAEYLAAGKQLIQAGKWREARAKLGAVLAIDPANFEAKGLSDTAQAKIEEDQHIYDDFESAKKFFADKDYENALRKFYRLPRDKDLGNIDICIRNSWFNWAVMSMRGGNATDVLQKLKELLDVDPDDAEALKIQEVAEHYVARAKDRVFYAFTDTLKLRAFDQK